MRTQIEVMNFDGIEHYQESRKHVVISIVSPGTEFPKLPQNSKRLGVIQLQFHDLDKPIFAFSKDGYFERGHARQIIDFAEKNKGRKIIVHCEAGISRSPAVAAALAYILNGRGEDTRYFRKYLPNRRVYSTILNEYFGSPSPH